MSSFELSLTHRGDGTLEAAYIRVRVGDVDRTDEIVEDTLLADYDKAGQLLGLELLGPITLEDLTGLVDEMLRDRLAAALERRAPEFFSQAA